VGHARNAAARHPVGPDDNSEVRIAVPVRNDNRDGTPPVVNLKAITGPGDGGEPVITIRQPKED
jgi:hypothetical protein